MYKLLQSIIRATESPRVRQEVAQLLRTVADEIESSDRLELPSRDIGENTDRPLRVSDR